MDRGKKKFSGAREMSQKGKPLGLALALAAAGGVVFGSAATYLLFKPLAAPKPSAAPAAPAAAGAPQVQTIAMPPQPQFTPAPQPPGEVPPGKVWSVEHGHWHDAPVVTTITAPATITPAAPPPPAPAAAPAEKQE